MAHDERCARRADEQAAVSALRAAGARFAFVFGSRATGTARPDSDLDVAAWWPVPAPDAWTVAVPDGVDLVVIDRLPLELAGRIALEGRLLFDDQPAERVRWQASTRKVYLDEEYRTQRSHREALEALARRG